MPASPVIHYLPVSGHVCTESVDALLDDEPGDYRGRHRADMAIGGALSHDYLALTGAAGPVVASCGSYLPGQPFRVSYDVDGLPVASCDHEPGIEPARGARRWWRLRVAQARAAERPPTQAYADYVEGFTS